MGRTFPQLELHNDLSVEENISVAAFGVIAEGPPDAIRTNRAVNWPAGRSPKPMIPSLSQGERQLVSIARACVVADAYLGAMHDPEAVSA